MIQRNTSHKLFLTQDARTDIRTRTIERTTWKRWCKSQGTVQIVVTQHAVLDMPHGMDSTLELMLDVGFKSRPGRPWLTQRAFLGLLTIVKTNCPKHEENAARITVNQHEMEEPLWELTAAPISLELSPLTYLTAEKLATEFAKFLADPDCFTSDERYVWDQQAIRQRIAHSGFDNEVRQS